MLNKLKLTCYRKHESLSIDFTSGLNAVRAPNEAGKSSVNEAIAYALYGSTALEEPLSEVVTYGRKEAELKVELSYTIAGVAYQIKRGKAGAELTYLGGTVTGQIETRKFNERLFGATADIAPKLMFASQSKVRGALEGGAANAVSLIENLANFSLIDELIELVQTRLPYGSTAGLQQQLQDAEALASAQIEDPRAPAQAAVDQAQAALEAAQARLAAQVVPDIAEAATRASEAKAHNRFVAETQQKLTEFLAILAKPLPLPGSQDVIDRLTRETYEAAEVAKLLKLKAGFDSYEYLGGYVNETAEGVQTQLTAAEDRRQKTLLELSAKRQDLAVVRSKVMTGGICQFCSQDFGTVPAVAARNIELEAEATRLEAEIATLQATSDSEKLKIAPLKALLKADQDAKNFFAGFGSHLKLDFSTTPLTAEWVGPTELKPVEANKVALELERQKLKTYNQAIEAQSSAKQAVVKLKAALDEAGPIVDTLALDKLLEEAKEAQKVYTQLLSTCAAAELALQGAKQSLQLVESRYRDALEKVAAAKAEAAKLKAEILEVESNVSLVKDIKSVRPKVAAKLWNMVLGGVSTHFSTMRGKASTVQVIDGTFKVDGHTLQGLSGSTKDALGLAIRAVLTKTFLPNVQFLILDEVAAGMDEEREAATLGLVSTCGFEQIIFVTHSELADSFANQVITF